MNLPGLPDRGDVSDWLAGLKSALCPRIELNRLGKAAAEWRPGTAQASSSKAHCQSISEYETQLVEWLWLNRIPMGAITILDGNPGVGKGTLLADIASRWSRGFIMPPGPPTKIGVQRGPGSVLYLPAEDDVAKVLRPRLEAAGADLTRCHVLTGLTGQDGVPRLVSLPGDLPAVEKLIRERQVQLVIIDPIMAYIGQEIDTNTDPSVRQLLSQVKEVAERTDAAFVLVRHLNKRAGGDAIYRGGGSIGFTAAARASLLVGEHPEDRNTKVLAMVKSNLGPMPESLTFTIADVATAVGRTSQVKWGSTTDLRACDVIDHKQERKTKQADTAELIEEVLAAGPMTAESLKDAVADRGIAYRTFRRAREAMLSNGIVSKSREGFEGSWYWKLAKQAWPWDAKGAK